MKPESLRGLVLWLSGLLLLELSKETRLYKIPKIFLLWPEFSFFRECFGLIHISTGRPWSSRNDWLIPLSANSDCRNPEEGIFLQISRALAFSWPSPLPGYISLLMACLRYTWFTWIWKATNTILTAIVHSFMRMVSIIKAFVEEIEGDGIHKNTCWPISVDFTDLSACTGLLLSCSQLNPLPFFSFSLFQKQNNSCLLLL